MSGFGEALRRERETRGISLDALSAETKVQSRHFLALEQDAFADLPSGVFRRGILRAYLRALHLEEQAWVTKFDQCFEDKSRADGASLVADGDAWVEFAENVRKNRPGARRRTDWRWPLVLLVVVAVVASGWALWHFQLHALVRN